MGPPGEWSLKNSFGRMTKLSPKTQIAPDFYLGGFAASRRGLLSAKRTAIRFSKARNAVYFCEIVPHAAAGPGWSRIKGERAAGAIWSKIFQITNLPQPVNTLTGRPSSRRNPLA